MFFQRYFQFRGRYRIFLSISFISLVLSFILYNNYCENINIMDSLESQLNLNYTSSPRILCFILTKPKYFHTRAKAVHDTWAPRCDRYFFITKSSQNNIKSKESNIKQKLPIAPIESITADYDHRTQKSTLAFLFAYENYINDFDWFVKADDDTYLLIDHLKMFLSEQNSSEPVIFGYNYKATLTKGYHPGGASYVLSQESLRRFYQAYQDPESKCRKYGGSEDVKIAKCLRSNGVYIGNSLDIRNRELFHPLPLIHHFHGTSPEWLSSDAKNPLPANYACCSDKSISFHYVDPEQQYLMDFLLYQARTASDIGSNSYKK